MSQKLEQRKKALYQLIKNFLGEEIHSMTEFEQKLINKKNKNIQLVKDKKYNPIKEIILELIRNIDNILPTIEIASKMNENEILLNDGTFSSLLNNLQTINNQEKIVQSQINKINNSNQ